MEKESGPARSFDPPFRFLFHNIPASRNSVISIPNTIFFLNTTSRANLRNAGWVAVKSLILSRNFAFSKISRYISFKSRILRFRLFRYPVQRGGSVSIKVTEEGIEWARAKVFFKIGIFSTIRHLLLFSGLLKWEKPQRALRELLPGL